jgi:Phosphotransferase enzyme family
MSQKMPVVAEDLTPSFLTELVGELRPGLTVEDVEVISARNYGDADNAKSVSTSSQIRIRVRYGGKGWESLPDVLLVKMSFPEIRGASNPDLDAEFENEVDFYNRIRPELDIETPLGLGGRYDPASGRFVLLMEDIERHSPHINSMADADNVDIVMACLDTFAKLHAHFWESPRFKTDMDWVQNQVDGPLEEMLARLIRDHIQKELHREAFKREFVEELGTTEEELYTGCRVLKLHQATLPQTFLHGDSHLANTYCLPNGKGGVFDWQVSARGYLMHDIGYYIQSSFSVDMRRKQEREMLVFYREQLCSYGVRNAPSLEELWLEYRRAMIYGFYYGWLTAPRENYGWEVMVIGNQRTKAACLDHDTVKLIAALR